MDGPRDQADHVAVQETRKAVRTHPSLAAFRQVDLAMSDRNCGLASSIISGVNRALADHPAAIVVEDDLVTSPFFLAYMREALDAYSGQPSLASVCGYWFPVDVRDATTSSFLLQLTSSWGWGTWRQAWSHFNPDAAALAASIDLAKRSSEFDLNGAYPYYKMLLDCARGANQSWAIRWYASNFLRQALSVFPPMSLVSNIGFDGSGTHCRSKAQHFMSGLSSEPVPIEPLLQSENLLIRRRLISYLRPSLVRRLYSSVKGVYPGRLRH